MPYIPDDQRGHAATLPSTSGQLNYAITNLLLFYLGSSPDYTRYNAAIGALECAKLELYRRQVALYENGKCVENGDVYARI